MARRALWTIAAGVAGLAAFAVAARVLDPGLAWRGLRLSAAEDTAIRATVVEFNRIYEDFYASGGDPALIDEFPATKAVKHHVFRDIGFVRDAGLVQVQDLASATVREVRRIGEAEAEAIVFEEWNHVLERSANREPASEVKGVAQGFRYTLRNERGRWIVTAWDIEELAPPPRTGEFKW